MRYLGLILMILSMIGIAAIACFCEGSHLENGGESQGHPCMLQIGTWVFSALLVVVDCYGFFLSQILIHACSHYAFTGWKWIDTCIGSFLSIFNFHTFAGWRALHMLHHRFTNVLGKDPTCPLPREGKLSYMFMAFVRMARFTRTPFYHENTGRGTLPGFTPGQSFSQGLARATAIAVDQWEPLVGLLLVATAFGASFVAWSWAGLFVPVVFWILPWVTGQLLLAEFNYRTHDGCPARGLHRPYAGQDTNSFRNGVWILINALTFGFYLHREHHIEPSLCLWIFGKPFRPGRKRLQRTKAPRIEATDGTRL